MSGKRGGDGGTSIAAVDGGLDVRQVARHHQRGIQECEAVLVLGVFDNGHAAIRFDACPGRLGRGRDLGGIEDAARQGQAGLVAGRAAGGEQQFVHIAPGVKSGQRRQLL